MFSVNYGATKELLFPIAVDNRVADLKAGLDLEMPFSGGKTDQQIVDAVKNGTLDIKVLDASCERLLNYIKKYSEAHVGGEPHLEEHDKIATEIAQESLVLLKNEGNALPLKKEQKVLFVGAFAEEPRYQGSGSSRINPIHVSNALEAAKPYNVDYAKGFEAEGPEDEKLANEAVEAAKSHDVVVVFAGLPDSFESEGFDRKHLNMPDYQNKLISRIAAVNKNTVVVLHNGAPIVMPWLDEVKGVLEAYIGGQAVEKAVVSILYGEVNPSGRLPETFPKRIEDTPCYGNFPGNFNTDTVDYTEGVMVGYRWYDYRNIEPLFPFGYGLSYTTFEISNIRLSSQSIKESDELKVTVSVKNTGKVAGKEVVQLYVGAPDCKEVVRPVRELRAFTKVALQPGESKDVTFTLGKRAFAYWSVVTHDWRVETSRYVIEVGYSSRDIAVKADVQVQSSCDFVPVKLDLDSLVAVAIKHPAISAKLQPYYDQVAASFAGLGPQLLEESMGSLPLRGISVFTMGQISLETLQSLCDEANAYFKL